MQEIASALEILKGAWPMIQPAISTVFGAVIARLFLRGNTSKEEIEKLKQAKFSEIADALLEGGHITHLEYYKCRNFNKIAQKADEIYQQHCDSSTEITDKTDKENIGIDWFVRFFEDAGKISDEDMQDLWAKVLAGEIKQPGSFSLRTLDTLKNLSKDEAEILQFVTSCAVQIGDRHYICIEDNLKKKYGYQNKLLAMYDCGIVENNIASRYDLTLAEPGIFMKIGLLICVSHNDLCEKYALDLQRFTKTGNEFIRFGIPNEQYFLDFFQKLNTNYPKLKLTVHRIIKVDGDTVQYNNNSLI